MSLCDDCIHKYVCRYEVPNDTPCEEYIDYYSVINVRCKDCKHAIKMEDFSQKNEPPYKYYRRDIYICTCEDLVGDYPMPVTLHFYCGFGNNLST